MEEGRKLEYPEKTPDDKLKKNSAKHMTCVCEA